MDLLPADGYQPRANEIAAAAASEILARLPGTRIEHIGSSAIPGAISKGDVDLCVLVAPTQFDYVLCVLEELGYQQKLDTLRTEQLCMLVSPRRDIDLAIQLITLGSEFEFFLTFRDALLASAELVERYNQVKLDAAHLPEDEYRSAKSCFIDAVLAASE
ncbi:MAG TPA: GrpB family protein [Pseudomonas sp.]|nr:GrpB family protein [Pseudomonas sp.]